MAARYVALARPVTFAGTGRLARREDLGAIEQGIGELLGTLPGEIEQEPEWGSLVRLRLAEPNDATLERELRADVADAIKRWEPRVLFRDCTVTQDAHATRVTAAFTLKGTRPAVQGRAVATFPRGG